ncbi:MAG: extracellular solute-binding protein [Rhodospirillales bacterium]|jgi:ABC-type oligopeptide transport system substrate-binding subunit|nr:extracellular solute-binding protein [Rhodospirillales bacterium]MDP7099492.1 extracellular solute-binding protein [Rhodospirillales bacterium]
MRVGMKPLAAARRSVPGKGALFFLALLLVAAVSSASAGSSHAIAMHGPPKYGPDFEHFDYADAAAPKGGSLILSRTGAFDSLNPFIIKGVPAAGLDLVFERLLKRSQDEPFTLYGRIAESVEVPDDRSSVTFTLRRQARFHDGSPITADDVIFSVETLRKKGRPNHRLYYRLVERMEKLGRRKIKLIFKDASNREMPLIMGLMPILSKSYYQGVEFERTTLVPPLGSGPYRIEAVDPGRSVSYRRDPGYWGRDLPVNRGQYNFDLVRYDYYRDGVVALEAFKAGLVDLRPETDPGRWASGYASPALKRGDILLEEFPHGRPAGMYGLVFNTRRPVFRDRGVRAALVHAFDFEWINKTLFHGAYERTASYFENSELAAAAPPTPAELALLEPYRDRLPAEVFSDVYRPPKSDGSGQGRGGLKRAMRLLQAAGWTFRGGRAFTAGGQPAAFEILLIDPRNERLALEYRRKLARLGVVARVRTVDSAQYQYRLNTYDFDMIVYLWDESLSPGNEQAFYWGSAAAGKEATRNYPGIAEPAADAMIAKITAGGGRSQLIAATRALDRILQWGHYVVPLFHLRGDRLAYWNRFARPAMTPIYGYQLDTWWEDRERTVRLPRRE